MKQFKKTSRHAFPPVFHASRWVQLATLLEQRPLVSADLQRHGFDPAAEPEDVRFGSARALYKLSKPKLAADAREPAKAMFYHVFQVPDEAVHKHQMRKTAQLNAGTMQVQFADMQAKLQQQQTVLNTLTHTVLNKRAALNAAHFVLPRIANFYCGVTQDLYAPGEARASQRAADYLAQPELSAHVELRTDTQDSAWLQELPGRLAKLTAAVQDTHQAVRSLQEALVPSKGWIVSGGGGSANGLEEPIGIGNSSYVSNVLLREPKG